MTSVELEIMAFLGQNPGVFFARMEICRKARGKEEYEKNPHWAAAPLNSLVTQGCIIQNESGHYAINPDYRG